MSAPSQSAVCFDEIPASSHRVANVCRRQYIFFVIPVALQISRYSLTAVCLFTLPRIGISEDPLCLSANSLNSEKIGTRRILFVFVGIRLPRSSIECLISI